MKSFRLIVLTAAFLVMALSVFIFRGALAHFFGNLRISFSGAADGNFSYENYQSLKTQNEFLTQNCPTGENSRQLVVAGKYHAKEARIFSDYPFNNYSAVLIDLGSDDGMKAGMPVLVSEGVLLGKVTGVKRTQSEVETIFDPSWRSAVAFGEARSKALLVGGPAPYLDLIPKTAFSNIGDPVFNLAKDFPINLLLGKIISWEAGENDVWARAKVEPPASFENLGKVLVVTDFP
ncbi:MAG: rod shape-determining protein MreC [Minisyncoccia bacterium]